MKTIILLLFTCMIYSQQLITTAGGDAYGNGSISYTIGQVIYINTPTVQQGIQQGVNVIVLTNPELKNIQLKAVVFPNPAKNSVTLSLIDYNTSNVKYRLFDMQGKLIKKDRITKKYTLIYLKRLQQGAYILKVYKNSNQVKTFKIIKN